MGHSRLGSTWYRRDRCPCLYHNNYHLPRCKALIPYLFSRYALTSSHRNTNHFKPPQDLIATVAALTLSIRVIGGAVGYTVYYNVFVSKFEENAKTLIGGTMLQLGIQDKLLIGKAIHLTSAALLDQLPTIPGIGNNETALEMVTVAGRVAYAESYKYVYYVSIAFGGVCTIAACFLGNINQYMDDHVAVVVH